MPCMCHVNLIIVTIGYVLPYSGDSDNILHTVHRKKRRPTPFNCKYESLIDINYKEPIDAKFKSITDMMLTNLESGADDHDHQETCTN